MKPAPAVGVLPIHHRIANDLRDQISSGTLQPGDPLPTIAELSKRWKCSDGPVRSALAVLRSEGRITSGRGKPALVRTPPTRIRLWSGWSQEQKNLVLRPRAERDHRGAIEMVSGVDIDDVVSSHTYDVVPALADLADEFSLPEGTNLSRRRYEMTDPESGVLLAQSVSYIPLHLIEANPALLDEKNEPWPGGHQHQLYTVGIEIGHFIKSVITVEPTAGDRQRWDMEPGIPMLQVRTRSVDIDDRVVELSDATYPGDRTELVFREDLERWPADYPRFDLSKGDK